MAVKGIIFDMDGLMLDTEKIYYKGWQVGAQAYGYPMTWEIYTQIVARNSHYIAKVLRSIWGEEAPVEAMIQKKRQYADDYVKQHGIETKPGLELLLETLEARKIKKAVATSSMEEKTKRYLEVAGIGERFDFLICGSQVKEAKPNPEIFLRAAEGLGLKADEVLVLEDSRLGIEAAQRAQMRSVFIPDLVPLDASIKAQATWVCQQLDEVIALLDSL